MAKNGLVISNVVIVEKYLRFLHILCTLIFFFSNSDSEYVLKLVECVRPIPQEKKSGKYLLTQYLAIFLGRAPLRS